MNNIKTIIENELGEKIIVFPSGIGKLETESGKILFLKSGKTSRTYQCEANGLKELAQANAIQTAKVILSGENFILTEYIEQGRTKSGFFEQFGADLACLHQHTSYSFGFYEDNYIGLNLQINLPRKDEKDNWIDFYFNKRLLYQFKMAEKNRYATPKLIKGISKLESRIESILQDSLEPPTLLHGDLWAGNFLCSISNKAVLIDPAVYYGHREADLAMTHLFGGFPHSFYAAYHEAYPLKEGWEYREGVYKLYHVLNHLNIFGTSYLSEAEQLIDQYI